MAAYQTVLADDHALFRKGLRRILEEMPDLKVIGEAEDGLGLLNLLKELAPHMVILDISMPKVRGLDVIHEIKRTYPDVKILILSMHKDIEYLQQAMSSGADGYLLKEDADTELFSGIKKIRQGGKYVSPHLSEMLREDWVQLRRGEIAPGSEAQRLTNRERQVLKLIAEGKSNKEISDLLFISIRTVERHRANLMGKLDLKNTADLVKYAIQKGYV
jgi:DNA-binding NarL/FixJ family response regulator